MNPVGLVAGAAGFLSIWLGHVAVRKVEASTPTIWIPVSMFVLAGIILEAFALLVHDPVLSAAVGILGITCLWDALELFRQEQRVRKGHAPANPANPRHQKIMQAAGSTATTDNFLRREPR